MRAAALAALRLAGRPLTRGEFTMFAGLGGRPSRVVQPVLDDLVADGLVERRVIAYRHRSGAAYRRTAVHYLATEGAADADR